MDIFIVREEVDTGMSGRKWIQVCQGGSGYRYVREVVDTGMSGR